MTTQVRRNRLSRDEIEFLMAYRESEERKKNARTRKYVPHKGQLDFHRCESRVRGLFTGNRWGKSRSAAQEWVWWCLGNHPYRTTPEPPVRIRVAADGYEYGVDKILIPLYRGIIDPRDLRGGSWEKGYSKQYHTITFFNGSTIELMSYKLGDMGRGAQAFAGVDLDGYQHEEHGPKQVWDENQARIGDRTLHSVVTYTPILGKTWEFDEIWMRYQRGEPDYVCFTGGMGDNPYLSKGAVESYLGSITDRKTREVREFGTWHDLGGMVYPNWDETVHVIPFDRHRVEHSTKSVIIDPHPAKPTAVLWCGVDRDQRMFAYREYRERKLVSEVADDIRRLSEREDIRRFLIDPHWGWKDHQQTGKSINEQYWENNIPVERASSDKIGRMQLLQSYLDVSPTLKKANFDVMQTCPRLQWEFEHKRFKPQTEAMRERDRWATIDEDDDLLVCAEYFVMSNPRFRGKRARKAGRVLSRNQGSWVGAEVGT